MYRGRGDGNHNSRSRTQHRRSHQTTCHMVVVFSKLILSAHVWSKTLQPKPASQEDSEQACMNLVNTKVKKEDR